MNIADVYNLWSDQYDINHNLTRDLDQKATIKSLREYEFDHVLELGCGTGKNTSFFSEKAKEVIAIDFSEEMLALARKKHEGKAVQFIIGDLTKPWEVKPLFADLISCNLVLEHIDDLEFIFSQAASKLKEDGLFFICELHPFKQYSGSIAKFELDEKTISLTSFTHHISDFMKAAEANKFKLLKLEEWFDSDEEKSVPRLISFLFKK